MTRPPYIYGIFVLCLTVPVQGQDVKAKPDPVALAKAGRATSKRFQNEASSWTTTALTPNGIQFVVEVVARPDMRRSVLSIEAQGRREEFARVFQKDDAWYVIQGRHTGKYRRFEAPLDLPTAFMYLIRSEPRFITEVDPGSLGTYERTRNGTAAYRNPLPESLRTQLQNNIAEFEKFKKQNPGQTIKPETVRAIDSARELIATGITTEVELTSGMLSQFGAPGRRTKVTDFRWRESIDPKEFATDGQTWDDHTDDPTSGNRDDLLMIGHCGAWRPGMNAPETDGRLLDLKTGRYRRIPFQGDMTLPGCFTRDRSRVVVSGLDAMAGVMGLYEIDLKTGANRQLGGDLLATGFSLFPSLSPDGKTVVVLHKGVSQRILEVQICLVDLATGKAKHLGKPRDTGPVSWFPDGRGLLTIDRNTAELSKPSIDTVCRMSLDGELETLCPGTSPVILGDGKTILFEDQASRTWKTCNLAGGDVRPFADGMKGHAFPAPSPDGKRILMMHFQPGGAPEPLIFAVGNNKGEPATLAPGLWTSPAWR
jgi:hypothetical protein